MYVDKEAMANAVKQIESLIQKGESFDLRTTAIPIEKCQEVSNWNDEVIALFQRICGGSKRISEFEDELKKFVTVGERFGMLKTRLYRLLEEITHGEDCYFRRFTQDEEIQRVGLL